MRKALMLVVATAVLGPSAAAAKPKAVGPICDAAQKESKGNFYGVGANQNTAKPSPNLSVSGKYRTDAGFVTISEANGERGGITAKTLFLKLRITKAKSHGNCQRFEHSFQAKTAQFNEVKITDPHGGSINVPVHVWRRR